VVRLGIRVLLVDNQELFRYGVKAAVQSDPAIQIIGEAVTADDAIAMAVTLAPDLVVMDVTLPDGDGTAAIRTIKDRCPGTHILVLASGVDSGRFRRAAEAGATGYVLKDIDSATLVEAIHTAYAGRRTLSPRVVECVIDQYFAVTNNDGDRRRERTWDHQSRLTPPEIDVLVHVAQGLSDKQIAAQLFLSESAVKTRLRTIYRKLGLRNRAHAAVFATEHRLSANETPKMIQPKLG
jgi:DNA-binding NarL/FixJ family response regulator